MCMCFFGSICCLCVKMGNILIDLLALVVLMLTGYDMGQGALDMSAASDSSRQCVCVCGGGWMHLIVIYIPASPPQQLCFHGHNY
jgi:hypothetical protein